MYQKICCANLWASKRFSNPVNCGSLNTVRAFRRRQCLSALTPIPKPRAISAGTPHPLPGKKLPLLNNPAREGNENKKKRVQVKHTLAPFFTSLVIFMIFMSANLVTKSMDRHFYSPTTLALDMRPMPFEDILDRYMDSDPNK